MSGRAPDRRALEPPHLGRPDCGFVRAHGDRASFAHQPAPTIQEIGGHTNGAGTTVIARLVLLAWSTQPGMASYANPYAEFYQPVDRYGPCEAHSMKRLAFALLLLQLAMLAYGQDFQKGAEAYNRGDYAAALNRDKRRFACGGRRTRMCALAVDLF